MIVSSFGSTLILPLMWPSFLKNSKNVSKISLFSPQYIALILFVQWCSSQWWCTKRKPIFFKYWDLCFGTKKDLKSRFTSFELFQLLVFSSLIEFWLNIKFPSGELSLDKLRGKIIFADGIFPEKQFKHLRLCQSNDVLGGPSLCQLSHDSVFFDDATPKPNLICLWWDGRSPLDQSAVVPGSVSQVSRHGCHPPCRAKCPSHCNTIQCSSVMQYSNNALSTAS